MAINEITAVMALVLMIMVFIAYLPLVFDAMPRWARWLLFGLLIGASGFILRLLYWDILRMVLMGEQWFAIRDALGGQAFSAVFNSIASVSCIIILHARVLLIERTHRAGWHWWNVWMQSLPKRGRE